MNRSLQIISLLFIIISTLSCKKNSDKIIRLTTVRNIIPDIIEENPQMSDSKKIALKELYFMSKSRNHYIKYMQKSHSGDIMFNEKYFSCSADYKQIRNTMFKYLRDNEITYRTFLSDVEVFSGIKSKYNRDFQDLYEQIDNACKEKQYTACANSFRRERLTKELNREIKASLIKIRAAKQYNEDVVEICIKLKNRPRCTIDKLSMNVKIYDMFGKEIANLNCLHNMKLNNESINCWSWSKDESPDIYNALFDKSISTVHYKINITEIIRGKNTRNIQNITDKGYENNYYYRSPKVISGYCPYLRPTDTLYIHRKTLKNNYSTEIKRYAPIYYQLYVAKRRIRNPEL